MPVEGYMSAPWREAVKRRLPAIVPAARLYRRARIQARYPGLGTYLDWRRTVLGGPFQGMRYHHAGIAHPQEILGIYEQCLWPAIDQVITRQPSLIIDVGAFHGYYAVGFALRSPRSQVIAYELDPTRIALIEQCRIANDISTTRLVVRGPCKIDDLVRDLRVAEQPFILMDIEGVEDALLRPDLIPALRHAEIVVELHDGIVPGVSDRIRDRFTATHLVRRIEETPLQPVQWDVPPWIGRHIHRAWDRLADGIREQNIAWFHLTPRSHDGAA